MKNYLSDRSPEPNVTVSKDAPVKYPAVGSSSSLKDILARDFQGLDVNPRVMKVSGRAARQNLVKEARAEYPAIADAAGITGTVRMLVLVAKDGVVENVRVISGHPMLVVSAMKAVRQWEYRPFLLNGVPTYAEVPVEIKFKSRW